MKKVFVSAFSLIMVIGVANAGFDGPEVSVQVDAVQTNPKGGFVGGNEMIVSVEQVKEMRDDAPVIVQGNILQRMGDEKYLFEDATGSVTIEIDDDDWRGQTVAPKDTVKLYGEVDKGIFKTEIDVDYIEKM